MPGDLSWLGFGYLLPGSPLACSAPPSVGPCQQIQMAEGGKEQAGREAAEETWPAQASWCWVTAASNCGSGAPQGVSDGGGEALGDLLGVGSREWKRSRDLRRRRLGGGGCPGCLQWQQGSPGRPPSFSCRHRIPPGGPIPVAGEQFKIPALFCRCNWTPRRSPRASLPPLETSSGSPAAAIRPPGGLRRPSVG